MDGHLVANALRPQTPCPGEREQHCDHRSLSQSRHCVPSSAVARFTLTRSCALYDRIIATWALSTRLTRTLAVFPPAVVYGRPITSYSPVSSVSRSPI